VATQGDSADAGKLGYRPDIDGLRAVAVLAVVLYHAGLRGFSGGFVGVDVFFVISGFLITSIIQGQLDRGSFSIAGFYERRIRRIFPALFTVCAATTAAAWCWMMPFELQAFGASLAIMALFASNFYFVKTGYFDGGASAEPLLHTWSLAVEEQFYIVFPIVLMLLACFGPASSRGGAAPRGRALRRRVVLLLALASLVVNLVGVRGNASWAFYMPWQRAWELLAGSLLALGGVPRIAGQRARELLALLGAGLIAVAVFGFDDHTRFPGEAALLPVLGAALIIHTGGAAPTLVARLLGTRAPVFIGLISYSLYLWHWPIFAFARYRLLRELSAVEGLALSGLAVLVAALSWALVERPFRHATGQGRARLFTDALLCCGLVAALGGHLYAHRGLPERLSGPVRAAAEAAFDVNPDSDACHNRSPEQLRGDQVCVLGGDARPSFVVLGDSFADALIPGIDAAARDAGRSGYVMTKGGCPPLFGVHHAACQAFNAAALAFIQRHEDIDTVVMMARWSGFAEGQRFGEARPEILITDAESTTASPEENRRVLARGAARSLAALAPRRVVLVAFMPEQPVSPPRALAVARERGLALAVGVDRATYDARQRQVRAWTDELARQGAVTVIDLGPALCDAAGCPGERDGVVLYSDDNHISRAGAIAIKSTLAGIFAAPR